MQVKILPAAPLPGGVKVARRFVKPHGVGASPTLAASFTEGRQIQAGCACPENRIGSNPRSERYRRPPPAFAACASGRRRLARRSAAKTGYISSEARLRLAFQFKPLTKGNPMKSIVRYQSQLLFRRSYKPFRAMRIRPTGRVNIVFRPAKRFGVKPQLTTVP